MAMIGHHLEIRSIMGKGSGNIIIVTSPLREVGQIILGKHLRICSEIFHIIRLISGNERKSEEAYFRQNLLIRLLSNLLTQLEISLQLAKIIGGNSIIYFPMGGESIPLLLCKMLGKKVIVFAPGSARRFGIVFYKDKFSYNLSLLNETLVFALSNKLVAETTSSSRWIIPQKLQKKVTIANLYVDIDEFRPIVPIEKREKLIAFVGRISKEKGVEELIKSFSIFRQSNKDWILEIVGSGPQMKEVKAMLFQDESRKAIRLREWIEHKDMNNFLNTIRILVLPSATEGLPNILLEAMASGCIVAATCVGGVQDLVRSGDNGFLIHDRSPSTIAKTLLHIVDVDQLNCISQNARSTVQDNFSIKASVSRFKIIFRNA
jgi:glycosyltransferase involved in cell wall biosynthesis